MHRRTFAQLLAGTGLFSFWQPAEAEKDGPTSGTVTWEREPVTIEDFIALAKAKLPKATFEYVTTGSEDQITLRDNVDAFRRLRLLPPLLHGVNKANLETTVLSERIATPVLLAPVAALRMYHPDGGGAAARAAAKAGTICAVSTSVGNSLEEVAGSAQGPLWFQLYVPSNREIAKHLVQRAERAGYKALLVTVDLGERKDADLRNRFAPPKEMLLKHLRDVGHTHLTDAMSYEEILEFNANAWELSLNADFFRWLRGITKLPILMKGVLSKEAALEAIELGMDGVIVSNHGGRRLDGMPASIDVLREVADAVDGRIEVLMDGGVRRGSDVLKAIAFGAKAVLIGRPQAWALAAGGEAGVTRALEILRDELTNAMIASGCATIDQIKASLIMPGRRFFK